MENNPYKTPESAPKEDIKFQRSVWWKIYFFFITILSSIGIASAFTDPNVGVSEYISLLIGIIATIGLFGFVFLKPIYRPRFWLQFIIAYIAFSIIYYFVTSIDLRMEMSDTEFYITNVISWLLYLPGYYGLYSYSRPNNLIWKKA